jgi:THO complex subunit 3
MKSFSTPDKIKCCAWSLDGKRLASGSIDRTCKIWSFSSKEPLITLKGHSESINALKWTADALASVSADKSLRLWDLRSQQATLVIQTDEPLINLACHPSGCIAVGSKLDTLSFIDPRMGIVHKIQNDFQVNEFGWAGDLFLIPNDRGQVNFLNPSYQDAFTLNAHTANLYCLDVDPTGRYFALGGADAILSIWDIKNLICVSTMTRFETPLRSIGFDSTGKLIAASSDDKFLDIWYNSLTQRCRNWPAGSFLAFLKCRESSLASIQTAISVCRS